MAPYSAMDRIKSLSESWRSCLNLSAVTDKLRKGLGRPPNSADRNPISTRVTIDGTDPTGIHNTSRVQDATGQAPLHAGNENTSEPSEVGTTSMERQGSVLDMNELPNLGMVIYHRYQMRKRILH